VNDYNTWGGVYAQHYFWKEEHARSYFAVALDAWIHPSEYFDSSTTRLAAAGAVRATCGIVIGSSTSPHSISELKSTSIGVSVQEEGSSSTIPSAGSSSIRSNGGSNGGQSKDLSHVAFATSSDTGYTDGDGVDKMPESVTRSSDATDDRTESSQDEVFSSSTALRSTPASLFGVLVLANGNTLPMLRSALCHPKGWMASGLNPEDVIVAGDFEPSALFSGRTSSSSFHASAVNSASTSDNSPPCDENVRQRVAFVHVPLSSNYVHSLSTVRSFLQHRNQRVAASAANGTTAGVSANASTTTRAQLPRMTKWPFLVVIQPFTLLRPKRLTAFLQASLLNPQSRPVMQSPAYVAGHIYDAVSDPSSVGLFPRYLRASPYTILQWRKGVGKDQQRRSSIAKTNSFVVIETIN